MSTNDDRADTWVVDLHGLDGGADDPLGPSHARLIVVPRSGLALTDEQRESISHALARAFKSTVPDAERDVYTITIPGLDASSPDGEPNPSADTNADFLTESESIAGAIADAIAESDYVAANPEPDAAETPDPLAHPSEPDADTNPDTDADTYSDSNADTSPESDAMRGQSGQP